MFKRILVPLDGSIRAERAIPVAARIARASGGAIILVRAVSTTPELWPSMEMRPELAQAVIDAGLTEAKKYLLAASTAKVVSNVPTETVVLYGPAATSILAVAHSSSADLVVLCSHGYTGITRWVMGSVAEKVAHHAAVPVLILREGGPVPAAPHPDATRPLRALVALDGSAHAKAALEPAALLIAALAAPAPGALHLVRIVKPVRGGREARGLEQRDHEEVLHKAKQYLSTTVAHLREGLTAPAVAELNLTITWSVAVDTDVADALIRVAENGEDAEGAGVFGGCDVIAMATHGYSGVQRWAMGSITERVLSATRLPLLVVRPPEALDKGHVRWDQATIATMQA
jgi:nucleotide-binding universal stress UspA family protein